MSALPGTSLFTTDVKYIIIIITVILQYKCLVTAA